MMIRKFICFLFGHRPIERLKRCRRCYKYLGEKVEVKPKSMEQQREDVKKFVDGKLKKQWVRLSLKEKRDLWLKSKGYRYE